MAGSLPGFDADAFRSALRFAMTMGAPNAPGAQATFYLPQAQAATGPVDASGVPFAPSTAVTRVPPKPVRVPVAIEQLGSDAAPQTNLGPFSNRRMMLTLLDEDYAKVVGFVFVVYSGIRYDLITEMGVSGLGTVDVHRLLVEARTG